jgi:hypothetical protein
LEASFLSCLATDNCQKCFLPDFPFPFHDSRKKPNIGWNGVGWAIIRHIFFIRIMNIFDLLFEYSNNIRIFILLNKLPILAQNLQNLLNLQKNQCWVEITE